MRTKSKWVNRVLTFYNGPVNDESVNQTTGASTTITNYGVTRCMATANAVVKFAAPRLGSRKTMIVADTTFAITMIANAATINNSTDNKIVVTPTTKTKALGFGFDLYGASTSQWYMRTGLSDINSTQVTVTFTSS
jgi:hypothetical protein